MKHKYEDFWHKELNKETSRNKNKGSNKLRTYKTIKQNFQLEPYLENIDNIDHIKAVTQLRLSSHNLNIECLRGTVHNPEHRTCNLCSLNEKEDEIHFITKCPSYTTLRLQLLSTLDIAPPIISSYNDTHWFIFLMQTRIKRYVKP